MTIADKKEEKPELKNGENEHQNFHVGACTGNGTGAALGQNGQEIEAGR